MANRIHNFNAGPSTLPLEVLEIAREELLDYRGTGMSIMEISHRSPEYEEINDTAARLLLAHLGLDDDYEVAFVGGGASSQFCMIPFNFLPEGGTAAYADTGTWSSKAIKEAEKLGKVHVASSSKDRNYAYIPKGDAISWPSDAAYLHLTSNNTIAGTQYHDFPGDGTVPVVVDMSSDVLCRRLDHARFAMIYAGAQKNLGPAGVTVVVIRKDFLARAKEGLPSMWSYGTHTSKKSLYNTPPVFPVYMVKLVLEWIEKHGGIDGVEARNREKQAKVYAAIDAEPDFFRGAVDVDDRSWMNLTFRLPSEDLEKTFVAEAKAAGLGGLKGHRSVGGIRVSLYNAMTTDGVDALLDFMESFRKKA